MKIMGDPCLVMNDDGATAVQENCQVGHMKHPLQSQFSTKGNRKFGISNNVEIGWLSTGSLRISK